MSSTLRAEVEAWIADDPDPNTAAELQALLDSDDQATLKKYFNGFLQFGTAGLRGPMGPGPSCMNRAVVGRAAAGIAAYMKKRGMTKVVVGRGLHLRNGRDYERCRNGRLHTSEASPNSCLGICNFLPRMRYRNHGDCKS